MKLQIQARIALLLILFLLPATILSQNQSDFQSAIEDHEMLTYATQNFFDNATVSESLGFLAPVAMSPFFGITLLSASSILVQNQILPHNRFLKNNKLLGNYYVLFSFLILSLLTSLPRFFKLGNLIGTVIAYIEDHAGLLIVLILQGFVFFFSGFMDQSAVASGSPQTGGVIQQTQMGFIAIDSNQIYWWNLLAESIPVFLLMLASFFNTLVIATVRYAIDLMVFLTPIPFIDALLETTKKGLVGFFTTIYVFSPLFATIINVFIFLISLLFFRKALRTTRYYFSILSSPLYHRIQTLFIKEIKFPLVQRVSRAWKKKVQMEQIELAIPLHIKTKLVPFKADEAVWLLVDQETLIIGKRVFPFGKKFRSFKKAHTEAFIKKRFLYTELRFEAPNPGKADSKKEIKLALSRKYNPQLPAIAQKLGASIAEDESYLKQNIMGALTALKKIPFPRGKTSV